MLRARNHSLAVILAVGLATQSPVAADVLVSNLGEPFRGSTPIGNNPNPVPPPAPSPEWYWAAQSFSTDANPYRLTSIDVVVGDGNAGPVVVAELRADDAGSLGALIATFTAPDVSGPPTPRTFVPDGAVTLLPNTSYWFVVGSQAPGDGTFVWSYADSNNWVGPGHLLNWAYSDDSGVSWTIGEDFPYFIQVDAVPANVSVLVTNLGEPLRASTPIGNNPNPVPPPIGSAAWYWAAQSFQPDGNEYDLISVQAVVGDGNAGPVVVAELRADDNGAVGPVITTFTAPDVSGPPVARTFLPDSLVTLQPDTPYWFLLGSQVPGDGTYIWSYADSNNTVGPGVFLAYAAARDSGVTWQYGADFPYFLQVNVVAGVPGCPFDPCDANCDGSVDELDIPGFVAMLTGEGAACSPCSADVDRNGVVNGLDLVGFVACLLNP